MTKPTFASVTDQPCTCNYLSDAANDPENPIVFDASTSEYQFRYGDEMLVIYHCPFCGGAAPESKRQLLFSPIPVTEEARLAELLSGIETIEDALRRLGQPNVDGLWSDKIPERGNEAPSVRHLRHIGYTSLSDTAEVWITERANGRVSWQLLGKRIDAARDRGTLSADAE